MQSRSNRNRLLSVLAVLLLLVMACSFSASTDPTEDSSDSPDLAATQASLEATQAALESAQAEAEAQAQAEAEAQAAAEAEQEEAPAEGDGYEAPAFYVEEWDEPNPSWTYFLTNGNDSEWDLYTQGGALVFDMQGETIWAYFTYDEWYYDDIRIDAEVRNVGANNNNVSLICRETERGWYEFNIANNGLYWILRFDSADNEYTQLYNGGSEEIRVGKDTNLYTAICEGTRLTLGVNGIEVRTVNDSTFVEGRAGISVASFDILPVIVEFNWVELSLP